MTQKRILILGDSPLVEEFTALCTEKGYDVQTDPATHVATDVALELTNLSREQKKANLVLLDELLPADVPVFSSAVTVTLAEQSSWTTHPQRVFGIGGFPTLLQGSLIEFVDGEGSTKQLATDFAASLGKSAAFVQDSAGMVMPRILSMLINEACFALMEGVASGKDIDTAMKLGTNYPSGPVEWGERIGMKHVYAVVSAMHTQFGEDRYRPAPFLRKAAFRGRSQILNM